MHVVETIKDPVSPTVEGEGEKPRLSLTSMRKSYTHNINQ